MQKMLDSLYFCYTLNCKRLTNTFFGTKLTITLKYLNKFYIRDYVID